MLLFNTILLLLINQIYSRGVFSDKLSHTRHTELNDFDYLTDNNLKLLSKLLSSQSHHKSNKIYNNFEEEAQSIDYEEPAVSKSSSLLADITNTNNFDIDERSAESSDLLNPAPLYAPKPLLAPSSFVFRLPVKAKRSFQIQTYYDAVVQKDGTILLIPKDVNKNHYFIG